MTSGAGGETPRCDGGRGDGNACRTGAGPIGGAPEGVPDCRTGDRTDDPAGAPPATARPEPSAGSRVSCAPTVFADVAGRVTGPLDAAAWDTRWARGETPWDMSRAAPPLVNAVARGVIAPPCRVLVVGCGTGHDARFLAARGFEVTGIDIAATAIERARALAEAEGVHVEFSVADLFALPGPMSGFDAIWEHTCFCAIDPARRDDYVQAVARALRPGGLLLGLFFDIRPETGPPFGTNAEELRHRFGDAFDVSAIAPADDSHPARLGRELFAVMTRRGA